MSEEKEIDKEIKHLQKRRELIKQEKDLQKKMDELDKENEDRDQRIKEEEIERKKIQEENMERKELELKKENEAKELEFKRENEEKDSEMKRFQEKRSQEMELLKKQELEKRMKQLGVVERIERPRDLRKSKDKDKDKWWTKFFSKNKLKKPNVVAVVFLRNNGNAELMELEPKNEMFSIYGKTYHERSDCVFTVTKDRIPMAIIPEWSLIPVGTQRWEEQDMTEKFSQLEEHVLRGIRHAELVRRDGEERKPITSKQVILWVIVAIIAGAVLVNYI